MEEIQIMQAVLDRFRWLCETPHGSGQETALRRRLADRLAQVGCAIQQDDAGNLWCDLPASSDAADCPRTILQAHMDMVCAVGAPTYVPARDPIRPILRDGWLCTAGESALGADCGAGVAVLLWLAEHPELPHPPLRLLFTVEEEIGLNGARRLSEAAVAGAAFLINLDGFRFGRLVVGAAGGLRERFTRPYQTLPAPEGPAYRIACSGFRGGHSGFDIAARRANAVLLLAELLRALRMEAPFALASFAGGTAFNAIPFEAQAEIVCTEPAAEAIERIAGDLCARYAQTDPAGRITVTQIERPALALDGNAASGLLTALGGFADGVYATSAETSVSDSSNLGRVWMEDGALHIDAMLRCMDCAAEQALHQSHTTVCGMCGFTGEIHSRYPAWPAKPDNALAVRLADAYERHTGQTAEITVQHVGLEPSYFVEKNPDLSCVCIGMELQNCHSPQERWQTNTIAPFVQMLADTLAGLARA